MRSQDRADPADEALLAGIAVGDEWAALVFVRRYQHCLFGLAKTLLGDDPPAEGLAEQAFLWIFRHAAVHDVRHSPVPTWARSVTRRLALDVLCGRPGDPRVIDEPWFVAVTSGAGAPAEGATSDEPWAGVGAGLARFPIPQRRAVALSALCGWTTDDIARAEDTPPAVVEAWICAGTAAMEESFGVDSVLVLAPEIEPPIGFEVHLGERWRAELVAGHPNPVPRIVRPGVTRVRPPHRHRIRVRRSGR